MDGLIRGLPHDLGCLHLYQEQVAPQTELPTIQPQEFSNPLRPISIELFSLLNTNKHPVSADEIGRQYTMETHGKKLNPTQYGFATLDEMLGAMPERIYRIDNQGGTPLYYSKESAHSADVQRQIRGHQDKKGIWTDPPSSSAFGKQLSSPIASGSTSRPPNILKEGIIRKIPPGDGGPRSPARCRLYIKFIQEFGTKSTDGSGFEMTVSNLMDLYKKLYRFPLLGKLMTLEELVLEMCMDEFKDYWTILHKDRNPVVRVAIPENDGPEEEKCASPSSKAQLNENSALPSIPITTTRRLFVRPPPLRGNPRQLPIASTSPFASTSRSGAT